MIKWLLAALLLVSCQPQLERPVFLSKTGNEAALIYGEDDRQLWRDTSGSYPHLQRAAAATAAIVLNSSSQEYLLGETMVLCEGERFTQETAWSDCTGVLIEKDVLLTAGHCVSDKNACAQMRIFFNYHKNPLEAEGPYTCQKILASENGLKNSGDFALIKLDRSVTQIIPVSLAKDYKSAKTLWSLSHPLGMPLMLSPAEFLESKNESYFTVATDTFKGSSGSPLFNERSEVVGILSRGGRDIDEDELYEAQQSGGCVRFRRCKTGTCFGETYYKTQNLITVK
ncbi:MAG: trypsin-like serine peptidase [Bdellovibrionia bacterium]